MEHKSLSKLIVTTVSIIAVSLIAAVSPAFATTYSYTGDTSVVPPGGQVFAGAGENIFTFEYDDTTEILNLTITYQQNAAGHLTNFFFFTISEGPMPVAGTESTIFFDVSHGDIRVTGHESVHFDGATQPAIDAASGNLLFSTLLPGANPVLAASVTPGVGSVTYKLSLDSSMLPGASFGPFIGIWFQSAGLDPAYGLYTDYNAAGRLSALEVDIGLPPGYGYYDVSDQDTSVPEPFTGLMLATGLAVARLRRK